MKITVTCLGGHQMAEINGTGKRVYVVLLCRPFSRK